MQTGISAGLHCIAFVTQRSRIVHSPVTEKVVKCNIRIIVVSICTFSNTNGMS